MNDFADNDVSVELRQYEHLIELPGNLPAVRDWLAADPIRSALDCFSIDAPPPLAAEVD